MLANLRFALFVLVVLLLGQSLVYWSQAGEASPASQALSSTTTPGTRTPVPTVTGWPTQTATPTFPPPPTMTTWPTANQTPPPTVTGWPTQTATPTQIPEATLTSTPTSGPVPTLLQPADGALMPQPTSGWYFRWSIPDIPNCSNILTISGPGGEQISIPITTPIGGSGTMYEYHYVTRTDLSDDALGPWTWNVTATCHSPRSSETRTFWVERALATVTPEPTRVVPTVTPYPQPATLLQPADGALMGQPVIPGEWYFAWEGETWSSSGNCHSVIHLTGPRGQEISEQVEPNSSASLAYEFQYLSSEYLSDSDLGPWTWQVEIICPQGESRSHPRTFWVRPRDSYPLYLPLLGK